MTSLTAYLLSGQVPPRPRGARVRTHTMESKNGYTRNQGVIDNAARAEKTRQTNIERVFNAVADGIDNIRDLSIEVGLSITTTQKALIALELEFTPPRVLRIKDGCRPHTFKVIE